MAHVPIYLNISTCSHIGSCAKKRDSTVCVISTCHGFELGGAWFFCLSQLEPKIISFVPKLLVYELGRDMRHDICTLPHMLVRYLCQVDHPLIKSLHPTVLCIMMQSASDRQKNTSEWWNLIPFYVTLRLNNRTIRHPFHLSSSCMIHRSRLLHIVSPLGGDKVSMSIHTYPHKPLRNIKGAICNHQDDCPFYLQPDFWFHDQLTHTHDTSCTESRCHLTK